jgi:hemolysin activation/secretion protein
MVFVVHALLDAVNRANRAERAIPFYERPTLGGETTLRAFGLSRFIDNTAWLVNLEERIQMVEKKLFDYPIDLEAAPFVDIGRVSRRLDPYRIPLKHIQVNPGVGLRLLARPNVVGRLDVAYGKDGGNVFVGLDYPF